MLPLQILVISLQHSKDRQAKVAREMAKTGLAWRFLDAVDGSQLDWGAVAYYGKKVKRLLGFELTPKEIGCYLSHMRTWQACVDQNTPTLVFEDDFVVEPHLESVLETLLQKHTDWDIVRLQALCDSADTLIQDFDAYRLVRNHSDPLGATAYLVNPACARRLLAGSSEIYEPLDHYLEHVEKHGLRVFAVKPYPVTVADPTRATSTITDRPDRLPLRGGRKIMRSLARFVDRQFSSNPYFPKRYKPE
jgi:glycosyl transferase, family 25